MQRGHSGLPASGSKTLTKSKDQTKKVNLYRGLTDLLWHKSKYALSLNK